MEKRIKGKVKFYNPIKGYGFIETKEKTDLFFHISEFKEAKILIGDELEFEIEDVENKKKAVKINKVKKEK